MTRRRNSVNCQRRSSSRRPPEVLTGVRNQTLRTLNPPLEHNTRRADLDTRHRHFSHEPEPESEPEFEDDYDYDSNDQEQNGADFASNRSALSEEQSDSDDQPDETFDIFNDTTDDDSIHQDQDISFFQPEVDSGTPDDYSIGNQSNLFSEPDQHDFMAHSAADDVAELASEHSDGTETNMSSLDEIHNEGTSPRQIPVDDYILINTQLSQPRNSYGRGGGRHRPIVIDATQPELASPRRTQSVLDSSPPSRSAHHASAGDSAHDAQQPRSRKRRQTHLHSATKIERRNSGSGDGSGSGGAGGDALDVRTEQSPSKRLKTTTSSGKDQPDSNAAPRPRITFKRELVREPTVDEKAQTKQRVDRYCALNTHVMELRSNNVHSEDALSATRRLLELNTELHTVWNYRRQIFAHLDGWKNEDGRQALLEQELAFLLEIIMKNIKSYWMWNHRIWALSQLPSPSWDRELKLVAKLLAVDARNFHGWDYRRFVVSKVKETAEDPAAVDVSEFAFTLEQINRDFANHSAWHNRSKLLPSVLQRCSGDERRKMMDDEIELIINAIYTDPEDQNAWLYHEWLLDIQPSREDKCTLLRDKVSKIRELLEIEDDSKRPLIELVEAIVALDGLEPGSVTDAEKTECFDTLKRLKKLDTYHVNKYADTESMLFKRWK
ncbi:Rab geranylgeranyltransferase [Coemansia interrupta]|uniref:Geranylgeranyl transferase type-2 subunit alpha n=1 Tax=Coemansia interrupta TaxID=1126814 RepID=A0A9W8HDS3_9FUNG|nr:Rab geranylgeranyltransferase [Coemansia interrupta]